MFARVRCLAVLLLLLAAVPAGAAVPSTMGYQGLLTDGGGNPLPSGMHALAFSLYKVPAGGAAVWSESHASVPVTNGQFSVVLGSVTPLTSVQFDKPYFLAISVDGGAELSPRIELASSPYALSLRTPFSAAATADTVPLLKLNNSSGYPAFEANGAISVGDPGGTVGGIATIHAPSGSTHLQLLGGNGNPSSIPASFAVISAVSNIPAWLSQADGGDGRTGILSIAGSNGSRFAHIDGENAGSGNPKLYMQGSVSTFTVDTNQSGDGAVAMPANSVGPSEMFGEPGISQNHSGNAGVALNSASAISCISTTITTPAAGYVTVDASSEAVFFGTTGSNVAMYQISQSATGPMEANYLRLCGSENWVNTNSQYATPYTTRTYFLSAGTYTFHLIAQKTSAAGGTHMLLNTIRATYIPASYGTVTTAVAPGQETEFDRVDVVPAGASIDGRPASPTVLGDLRDLELRATRARLDVEKADRELAAARAEAQMAAIEKRALSVEAKQAGAGAAK